MSESSSEQGGFVVDEAAYQRYKSIIEAAKAQKKAEIFRKPTRASGVLEKDARVSLQAADEAFECQDWYDAMQIYEDLHEFKLGPKSIASKLSLCLVIRGEFDLALPLAIKAIDDAPLDSNAYISLAIMKGKVRHCLEAERLLQLAELTSNPNTKIIAITRRENTIHADIRKHGIASFRHLMKFNPDFIEAFKASDTYHEVDDPDSVIESMTRVQENPDCLEEEMASSAQFEEVVFQNVHLPETTIPRHFDDQFSRQFAQSDCPFHNLNSSAFLGIVKYMPYHDLVNVRRTCRYLEYIGGFPENFKLIVTRLGIGCPPAQQWTRKRHEQYLHEVATNLDIIFQFLQTYISLSKVDPRKESGLQIYSEKLRPFQAYLYPNVNESDSIRLLWNLISEQLLNWSENRFAKSLGRQRLIWDALECAFRKPTPTYFDDYSSVAGLFINLVVLGKVKGPFPDSIVNRLWSLLESAGTDESSAALAVCFNAPRLSEMNLISVCVTRSRVLQTYPVHQSRLFVLDGIWQGVQSYVLNSFKDIREECIMNLKFPSIEIGQVMEAEPTPFEMIGIGIDSFGEFEMEDPIIDNLNLTITFTKVYRQTNEHQTTIKHCYVGKLYPSGIGGSFGCPLDGGKSDIVGFFFYGRPLACADAASGYSPSFPTTTHTDTMSWDDLLPSISKRVEENANAIQSLLQRSGLDSNTKAPLYDFPVFDEEGGDLIHRLRNIGRDCFLSRLPSTSLSEIRAYLKEHKESNNSIPNDILPDRFPCDSDTKWHLRCRMMRQAISDYSQTRIAMMIGNLDRLESIGNTLKQFNFDENEPEVKLALQEFLTISHTTDALEEMDARGTSEFIDRMKIIAEECGIAPRVNTVPYFVSDDLAKMDLAGICLTTNRPRRGSRMLTILLASAVAASALVLGTYAVGRVLLWKQKSSK